MWEDTADPATIQQAQLDQQRETQAWSSSPDASAANRLIASGVPLSTTPLDGTSAQVDINGQTYFYRQADLTPEQRSLVSDAGDPYLNQQARAGTFNSYAATPAGQQAALQTATATGNQNAYQGLLGMFGDYGLESLAPTVLNLLQQGYDATSISYMLRQTPEYKARFAGNDGRIKNGLAPLSPAEYLATERAYRQALASAGLPASYYDNHADFTKFIENDTSPAEIKTRADQAMQFVNDSDPAYVDAFRRYYGAGTGDIAAYFLDGSKNEALLTKQITASQIGAAATKQGLSDPGRLQSEKYADAGISQSQAEAGFGAVADVLPAEQKIGSRFGQQYSQQDAQDEFLGGMASARRKRQQLNNDEEGLFAGSSGIGSATLKQNTSGSY